MAKLQLHDLKNVNTVIGMLYDKDGKYRAGFNPDEFYNTILLDSLKYGEENYVHLKYAETVNVRRGETTARFRRWAGLTPTLRPLLEGVPPAPDKHAYETIEVGNMFSFGRWSEYTDRVDLSQVSEIIAERTLQYGEVANQTKELYARKTWLAAPNEFYAGFKAGFADLGFGDEVTLDHLRFLIQRMKRMMVKPIGGKFNYICSSEFINGLIDDERVKQYMQIEKTTGKLWGTGEPFDMFELSFIPTMLDEFAYPDTEFPGVYELADGKEAIRLYAADGNKIYLLDVHQDFVVAGSTGKAKAIDTTTRYLKDGTAVDEIIKWELPTEYVFRADSSADDLATSGAPTSTKAVLRIQTFANEKWGAPTAAVVSPGYVGGTNADAPKDDLTKLNALLAAGAFMQLPVHRGILFGDEALLKINVDGVTDAPKVIIKNLGSSGVSDPLDQRQSVGFKVDGFGLAIKRPEAIVITYGIPKNAELAALTAQTLFHDYNTLTQSENIYNVNHVYDGEQSLEIPGINAPGGGYATFSPSVSYSAGKIVSYNDKLYIFTKAHTGAWDAGDVKAYTPAKPKAVLEHNPLDNNGNDPDSNVR